MSYSKSSKKKVKVADILNELEKKGKMKNYRYKVCYLPDSNESEYIVAVDEWRRSEQTRRQW